jgi:DNA-binding transcriptional LysR family regulator
MECLMDRLAAMRTFVAVIEGGSLSAAARALDTPLATISRRISDLEAHLRAQLVVRTSRKLQLTNAGLGYLACCQRILEMLDDAERAASGEYRAARGDLTITAPVMFGWMHVEPIVLDFLKEYPEINVRLMLSDVILDMADNHIDLAVRIGRLPDSSLIAMRVGSVRWVTCASPGYLAEYGSPPTPQGLSAHDCIAFEGQHASQHWVFNADKDKISVPVRPRLAVNTASAAVAAALSGFGIARLLSYQVRHALAEGRLVRILREFEPEAMPVHLVYSAQQALPLKLRAFIDFAAQRIKSDAKAFEGDGAALG